MSKIKVPEGMQREALASSVYWNTIEKRPAYELEIRKALESALRWQREDARPKLDAMLRQYLGDDPHDINAITCENQQKAPP